MEEEGCGKEGCGTHLQRLADGLVGVALVAREAEEVELKVPATWQGAERRVSAVEEG